MADSITTTNGYKIEYKNNEPIGCSIGSIQTLEQAATALDSLYVTKTALPFIIGDLCNAIREKWQDWEQILPDIGRLAIEKKRKTLINWASICDRIPHAIRFPTSVLGFSHHAEVAYVEDDKLKRDLLQWAADNDATVQELREERQRRVHPDSEVLKEFRAAWLEVYKALEDDKIERVKAIAREMVLK